MRDIIIYMDFMHRRRARIIVLCIIVALASKVFVVLLEFPQCVVVFLFHCTGLRLRFFQRPDFRR